MPPPTLDLDQRTSLRGVDDASGCLRLSGIQRVIPDLRPQPSPESGLLFEDGLDLGFGCEKPRLRWVVKRKRGHLGGAGKGANAIPGMPGAISEYTQGWNGWSGAIPTNRWDMWSIF